MAQAAYKLIIDEKEVLTSDPQVSGRDILALAKLQPASDFFVVAFAGQGTQMVGLDKKIDLKSQDSMQFRTFKGDRVFRATLNERGIVWGETISTKELRAIGDIPDDYALYLDSDGDRLIEDDIPLSLSEDGVERVRSGERLNIVINGELKQAKKQELSYSDLAKLAFPNSPEQELSGVTVSFSNGPKEHPKGTLLKGETVKIIKDMVFDVTPTDKS